MTKTILNGSTDGDKDVIQSDQISESNINDHESEAGELAGESSKAENKENSDVSKNGETSKERQQKKTEQDPKLSEKLEKVKRKLSEKPQKTTLHLSSSHPIRKRRKTMTESDYHQQKSEKPDTEEKKRVRAERLRQIEENKKLAKDPNDHPNEVNRVPFVPKVKNATKSRGDLLSSDMMASESK